MIVERRPQMVRRVGQGGDGGRQCVRLCWGREEGKEFKVMTVPDNLETSSLAVS